VASQGSAEAREAREEVHAEIPRRAEEKRQETTRLLPQDRANVRTLRVLKLKLRKSLEDIDDKDVSPDDLEHLLDEMHCTCLELRPASVTRTDT